VAEAGGIGDHISLIRVNSGKLLTVKSLADLDAFRARFGVPEVDGGVGSGVLGRVPSYCWRDVAKEYSGWAMPVNLYNPDKQEGWGVCGYDVGSLAVWDGAGCVAERHDWDIAAAGKVGADGWWTVRDTVLPLVRGVLGVGG
jgi:hypothetical protein